MCIRDSREGVGGEVALADRRRAAVDATVLDLAAIRVMGPAFARGHHAACLLYTSDAADERSSVDLGGRRIIQKKTKKKTHKQQKRHTVKETHNKAQ